MTAANMLSPYSTPTRGIPPRGRQLDVAVEAANPLGDSVCSIASSLTFGAVDVSWTPPLQNVFTAGNQSFC